MNKGEESAHPSEMAHRAGNVPRSPIFKSRERERERERERKRERETRELIYTYSVPDGSCTRGDPPPECAAGQKFRERAEGERDRETRVK